MAVVFHGPVVKLLSSDRSGFDKKYNTEIDQVSNGFISVAGYQAQGYTVVTIP